MTICPELEVPVTQSQVVGMVMLLKHHFPRDLRNLNLSFTRKRPSTRCAYMSHGQWRIVFHLNGLTEETVLHEIAHCLCPPSEWHGERWKSKMKELCTWWKNSSYRQSI